MEKNHISGDGAVLSPTLCPSFNTNPGHGGYFSHSLNLYDPVSNDLT